MVASGCLVTAKGTGTVGTSGPGTTGPRTGSGAPDARQPNTDRPKPRGPVDSRARDWRRGRLGGAAKFAIEPSIGPVGTVVNIYGTFRPAFAGGAVTCTFSGAQPTSPYFVSMRRMVVGVPQGAKSGPVRCRVGNEVLWRGRFFVTAEMPDIFVPINEEEGVLGAVYRIPAGTSKLPDFKTLGAPIGTFVVPTVHITPRTFRAGFPGVETEGEVLREWYAIRYVGLIDATREADYTFKLKNSDGAKLYIDDKLIIDNDMRHPPTEKEGTVKLTQGKHRIVVEYFKSTGDQIALELWWKRGVNPFSGVAKHSLSRYSVEYECAQQPVTFGCCKAMTPACRMCAQRQKAIMDAWRRQCRR